MHASRNRRTGALQSPGRGSGVIQETAGHGLAFAAPASAPPRGRPCERGRRGTGDGGEQLGVGIEPHVEHLEADPQLLDVRYGLNPDPEAPHRVASATAGGTGIPPAGGATAGAEYVGGFDEENWLEEWMAFGPDPDSRAPLAGSPDRHR